MKEEKIKRYVPMVKRIAYHLRYRLPDTIQVDDLIQAGMIGLLNAMDNYNADKGASFETYANIRIRGTMLDEVRKNDWVPRSVYRNVRRINAAVNIIENRIGRDAKDIEVANELKITLKEYHYMLRDANATQFSSYDDVGLREDLINEAVSSSLLDPVEDMERDNFCDSLIKSINNLPEKERLVLSLYYDDELNLKMIGNVLGVSESRISQIHSKAMCRIQASLPEWKISLK